MKKYVTLFSKTGKEGITGYTEIDKREKSCYNIFQNMK